MSEELLKYYNRELAYLRREGAEFARKYPQVAGRLRMNSEAVEDPHVSRLLEGVAFLTAQIRQRLDDQFAEFSDILQGNLYPDYQAPIPAMTVVKLQPSGGLAQVQSVPAGIALETTDSKYPRCEFRTGNQVHLAPLEITDAQFENAPFSAPKAGADTRAQAVLRLRLSCTSASDQLRLRNINLPELKIYLQGQTHLTHELYDLLHQHALGFAIAAAADSRHLQHFAAGQIQPGGFAASEALIPYSDRSFSGYRLLVEHFLFPEKFLFTTLQGLLGCWPEGRHADIYIYFSRHSDELEKHLRKEHLQVNCATAVNVFETVMEPAPLQSDDYEYRLVQRHGGNQPCEVLSVSSVELVQGDKICALPPYYGSANPQWQDSPALFWHSRRQHEWHTDPRQAGTQTSLSLVDKRLQQRPLSDLPKDEHLLIRAHCCNRNIPAQLPCGNGKPFLRAIRHSNILGITTLTAPTATVRPLQEGDSRWQLLQHLCLDHFAGEDATAHLRAVLQLHDFRQTAESQALIKGIDQVHISTGVARLNQGVRRGFCHGHEISIRFSRPRYAGSSVFLFASVLEHFFAQFAHINTYTRLRIDFTGKPDSGHIWPARSGQRELL